MNPMPGMICAAMRAASEGTPASPLERTVNIAAPKQMNIFVRSPAGLRTNMFICFGAAMFTVLSSGLAGVPSDAARIAAQIIPGIGFIGAGSILHNRGLTTGLTTASTLFVVASVGMAAGGGFYVTALFATGLVLLALFALGHMEETFNIKLLK